LSNVFRNSKCS